MHVRFDDADENFIKTEVQGGFQEAIAKGIQAVERGETVTLTSDLLQEIKQNAIRKARNGLRDI